MIIYLHGLNSSSKGSKAIRLQEEIKTPQVFVPDYPAHRPEKSIAVLTQYIQEKIDANPTDKDLLIIGSSMGGFYAQYLARQFSNAEVMLINPALDPANLFKLILGENENYHTGEKYTLTPADLRTFHPYYIDLYGSRIPTTVFLDKGDEVLDYKIAEITYKSIGTVFTYAGGSHGFDHLDNVIKILEEKYYSPLTK
ncbi:MAG: YqiA/YcfP family alpha/beta fold hydrolase [Alphaproteobacteria bacterium]